MRLQGCGRLAADVVVSQPITQITGADSGAGTAVNAGGNFGTGVYTADAVDPSEINPIDYTQFTGDVGSTTGGYDVVDPDTGVVTPGTSEQAALFGPKINIPTSVSQYMTDPVTGGLTTSYGPEMVATSPIGAIKLPARPVSIDIFDWLSTPTYGTMYSGMRMGGEVSSPFSDSSVPRQTEIAGQPHMLAYINPEEETLLRGLGGSGNPGPGGIPAYNPNEDHSRDTGRTTGSMRADDQREGDGEDNDDFSQGDPFGTNALLDSLGIPDFDPNTNFGGDGDGEDNLAVNPDTFIINPELIGPELVTNEVVNPVTTTYVPELVTDEVIIPQDVNPVNDPYIPELVTNEVVIPEVITTDDVINLDPYVPELVTDEVIIPEVINPDPYVSRPVFPNSDDGNRYIGPNSTDEAIKKAVADNKAGNMDLANSSLAALAGRLSRGNDVMPARLYDINAVSSDFAVPPPKDTTYSDPDEIFDLNNPLSLNASQVVGLNPRIDANGNMLPGRADTAADIEAGTLSSRNFAPEFVEPTPAEVMASNRLAASESKVDEALNPTTSLGLDPAPNMALPGGSAIPSNIQLEMAQPNSGPVFTGPDGKVLTSEDFAATNAQARLDAGPANRVRGLATGLDTMALEEAAYPPAFSDDMRQVIVDNMQPLQATAEALKRAELDVSALDRIAEARMPTDDMQIVDDMRSVPRSSPEFAAPVGDLAQFEPKVIAAPVQTAPAVSPEVVAQSVEKLNPKASDGEIANIKSQLDESVPVQGFGKFMANVGQSVFLGLGSEFVQGLVNKTEAQRTNIVAQHMSAINEGATPKYNEEGKYIGYDTSTMGTFADKVLAGDAREFLPPTLPDLNYTVTQDDLDSLAATNKLYKDSNISTLKGKDLDGDGLPDTRTNLVSPVYGDGLNLGDQINMSGINSPLANEYASGFTDAEGNPVTDNSRFQQIYNVQSEAAEIDPNGSSTENGFITSDGREFVVTYDGKLLEVNDGVVGTGAGIFNDGLGTGTTVSNVYNIGDDEGNGDGDDNDSIVGEIDTGYTIDESGNRICNEAGYVYDVASDACIIAEELSGNGNASLNIGSGGSRNVRSFNDVLRSIETRPAKIAPISANIKPMAQGGMAGLNRAADNFLRALGG